MNSIRLRPKLSKKGVKKKLLECWKRPKKPWLKHRPLRIRPNEKLKKDRWNLHDETLCIKKPLPNSRPNSLLQRQKSSNWRNKKDQRRKNERE